MQVAVYDLLGRRISVLHNGPLPGGRTATFSLSPTGWAPGAYFLRIAGDTILKTQRVTVVR